MMAYDTYRFSYCFLFSHTLDRQNLHFQLFSVLFTQMMKKFWLMHVGPSHIFQMVQMIKFKLLLMQVYVPVWLSFYCEYFILTSYDCWVYSLSVICPNMVVFCNISHPSPSVLIPALRTVGNIVTGDDMQTQVLNTKKHVYLYFLIA